MASKSILSPLNIVMFYGEHIIPDTVENIY